MKAIRFNKQQLEAYKNGATMFIVPIVHPCEYYSSRDQQAIRIEPENDSWYKEKNYCIREEGGGWQDFTKEDFLDYVKAPLMIGDEFFIQEEFKYIGCKAKNSPMSNFSRIAYYDHANYNNLGLATGKANIMDASQMTQEKSRYKDVCLNIEVKVIDNIETKEFKALGYVDVQKKPYSTLNRFNKDHGFTFQDNKYVILYTIEGIDK